MTLCQDHDHREAIRKRMQDVAGFQAAHSDRVKEPDTTLMTPPDGYDVHLDPDRPGETFEEKRTDDDEPSYGLEDRGRI